jgi:diadenosine tetraphosphate (Ap4A) HIT family hydrolase
MHFHIHVIPTEGEAPPMPRLSADQADIAEAAAAVRGKK